jgi:hypothetical protein
LCPACAGAPFYSVMARLVPAIHVFQSYIH